MEAIKFIFSNFWVWLGSFMILVVSLRVIVILINRILRHRNIRKLGYPPEHCDADGDFPETEDD